MRAIFLLLLLGGCTAVAVPPGTTLSTPQTQAAAAGVQAYGTEVPAGAKQIGMVRATACQRFQWDPIPTNDMALELLKGEARKAGGNAGTLHLFDIMPEDDWKRGGSDMPWMQRKAWLCDLVNQWQDQEADRWEWIEGSRGAEGPTPIRAIPHRIVRSAGEVRRLVADIWARGGEGAVLKALDAGYQRNRVSTQMKVKRNGER